jgi:hypothetical protein
MASEAGQVSIHVPSLTVRLKVNAEYGIHFRTTGVYLQPNSGDLFAEDWVICGCVPELLPLAVDLLSEGTSRALLLSLLQTVPREEVTT